MKRNILILTLLACVSMIKAQTYELNLDAEVLKNYSTLKKGASIHIKSLQHTIDYKQEVAFSVSDNSTKNVTALKDASDIANLYILNTDAGNIEVKDKLENVLNIKYNSVQDYWNAQILFNVLEQLNKKGTQVGLREEMESDVLEYINKVQNYGITFNDPYLESYIYSIISKIAPAVLIDGRPGNVNLLLVSSPIANAGMYPNGTLEITTGLISLLHSEDELAAVIAHEIAHFVLDHSVQNYNKMIARQKRAEFWAGFATVMTGVAEGVAAANNSYYRPGAATVAVAIAASQIASEVCKRLGMAYTRSQEEEADKAALELLKLMKYDNNALATALSRIEESLKQERSLQMYFASDHPALIERIDKAGTPSNKRDVDFEKIISFAVSDAATMKMQDRRFRQALPLVSQNIDNGVAIADDYIQKANCILYLRNDNAMYAEIMSLISDAKKYDSNNINIYKTEIISHLRQKRYSETKTLLNNYKERLKTMMLQDNNLPEDVWSQAFKYAKEEYRWADDMAIKLRAFN